MYKKSVAQINEICTNMRIELIKLLHRIQTGHPGGSLSVCEILGALYFNVANVNPKNPKDANRDRIVLTKGHAAPMLYLMLAEKGFFAKEDLKYLRQTGSHLQGHPSSFKTPGVEISTGPLGIGLSAAIGIALTLKMNRSRSRVYAIMGDGELNEGTVWEAMMSMAKFKVDNLVTIVDYNGVQLDGSSDDIMPLGSLRAKFEAFGLEVFECDGHDVASIIDAVNMANEVAGKPSIVLAKTIKGKGISFMEGQHTWHGAPIDDKHLDIALRDLGGER